VSVTQRVAAAKRNFWPSSSG